MMIVILFAMSWISSVASAFHDPPVSIVSPVLIATGMKMWVLVMPVYFVFLMMVALSAAASAWREVLSRLDCAYVSGTVMSQAIGLPRAQGINVAPSGCLASSHYRPTGSLEAGTWAFFIALHIMSLTIAWQMCLGPLFLHARQCRPRTSTWVPHTHVWGWHVFNPRRCSTATLMASSDNRRRKEGIRVTFSQSPALAAPAAFSLDLSILLLHRLRRSS